eukprot:157582-Chlamydomonas_euryale.AAC.1
MAMTGQGPTGTCGCDRRALVSLSSLCIRLLTKLHILWRSTSRRAPSPPRKQLLAPTLASLPSPREEQSHVFLHHVLPPPWPSTPGMASSRATGTRKSLACSCRRQGVVCLTRARRRASRRPCRRLSTRRCATRRVARAA